jgi:hypothetical protein
MPAARLAGGSGGAAEIGGEALHATRKQTEMLPVVLVAKRLRVRVGWPPGHRWRLAATRKPKLELKPMLVLKPLKKS